MQAYKIALGLFMFNWIFCMFSAVPFWGSAYDLGSPISLTEGVYTYEINTTNETFAPGYFEEVLNITTDFVNYQPTDIANIGLLEAVLMVISAFAKSTALLPLFMSELGIPLLLNLPITAGVWFTYGWGLLQFVRGMGDKSMR
jgi:hypothetical protein